MQGMAHDGVVVRLLLLLLLVMGLLLPPHICNAGRAGAGKEEKQDQDVAHELTSDNYNETLWAAPASWAIVEFFAHWCPACRNYKPHYERVAKLFNGLEAAHPGVVYMAKVDCAEKVNKQLCQRFAIAHFPTLLWGTPAALAWGNREGGKSDASDLEVINARTADALLQWINNRIDKSYTFIDIAEKKQVVQLNTKMVASIHDIEEATAKAYEIILENKLLSPKHRAPFVQFLQLLVVHHPSKRCRKGSADILVSMKELWPSESLLEVDKTVLEANSHSVSNVANVESLQRLHICGERVPKGYWKTCRAEASGYSCGLWFLLHSLSVRVDDMESLSALKAMRDFIGNFFICQECREHFLKMSSSAMDVVSSRRNLVLWLWRAHNEVTKRVSKEDNSNEKAREVWPPVQICRSCRQIQNNEDEVIWDEGKVYGLLVRTYGQALDADSLDDADSSTFDSRGLENLSTPNEDTMTSNSVAVPVGAAAGIGIASCGFGVAACCWRVQQKKRKQMRRRN